MKKKQVIFEIQAISLVFMICIIIVLAALNFKEADVLNGIVLVIDAFIVISLLYKFIQTNKKYDDSDIESIEDKSTMTEFTLSMLDGFKKPK